MIANADDLLRVAFPSNATAQQTPPNRATDDATSAQQPPTKPASLLDIARNKLRNKYATTTEKDTQQPPVLSGSPVAQNQSRNNTNPTKYENPITTRDSSVLRVASTSSATAQQTTSWHWLLNYRDHAVEVTTTPPSALAEMLRDFPGAIAAEPIPDTPKRKATDAESKELTALVNKVYANDTESDRAEALEAALADPDDALICYRAMRDAAGTRPEPSQSSGDATTSPNSHGSRLAHPAGRKSS